MQISVWSRPLSPDLTPCRAQHTGGSASRSPPAEAPPPPTPHTHTGAAAPTPMATPASEPAGAGTPEPAAPFSADWKERILLPAAVAGEPPPTHPPKKNSPRAIPKGEGDSLTFGMLCRCGRSWIRAAVAAPGSPWRRPRHRHLRRQPRHRRRVLRWWAPLVTPGRLICLAFCCKVCSSWVELNL